MATPIDALITLQKARNNSERVKALRRYASVELKSLLRIALRDTPLWPTEFPEAPSLTKQIIYSDQKWYHGILEFEAMVKARSHMPQDVVQVLAYMLALCTPSQRDWTIKILSGDLGFPLTKWDVQGALGDLHSL